MDITTSKRVRTEGTEKPTTLFDFHRKNGSWSYNFDPIQVEKDEPIMSNEVQTEDGVETTETETTETTTTRQVWQWYIIDVGGIKTRDNVKKRVMDFLWGVDYENKLTNEYNAYKEKITTDKEVVTAYKTFLQERLAVMEKIDSDFSNLNSTEE